METSAENDILAALFRLRQAFHRHDIPCPDVLEYSDIAQAYKALAALRHTIGPSFWGMDYLANPYGQCSLGGFTVRFEARKIETPGDGTLLDDGVSGRVFLDNLKHPGPDGEG